MDALFFWARREDALGVASSDDLPVEPAADALRFDGSSPIAVLGEVLGVGSHARPLRDATCRSFPVWELDAALLQRIEALDDSEIDGAAEAWHAHEGSRLDADLYELACCLRDLREAIHTGDAGEALFVLLEERAW